MFYERSFAKTQPLNFNVTKKGNEEQGMSRGTGKRQNDLEINGKMGNKVTDKPKKGFKLGLVINFFSRPACLFHVFVKLSSLSKRK